MTNDSSRTPTRRRLRWGLLAAAAAAGPVLMSTGPAGATPSIPIPPPAPVQTCRTVDFRTATVDPLVSADPLHADRVLKVTGILEVPGKVTLEPLVYVRQPEHWGIEVVACTLRGPILVPPDRTLPVLPPRFFTATLKFNGTFGTCGVEVIGANLSEKIDLGGPGCERIGPAA
jgi:hypothetical protein